MAIYAIVTAAGSGTRLGYDMPKACVPVAGIAIVTRTCMALVNSTYDFDAVVVSAPCEHIDTIRCCVDESGLPSVCEVSVVAGGVSRQQSVYLSLQELKNLCERTGRPVSKDDIVLIFDAARCGVPDDVICRVIERLQDARGDGRNDTSCAVVPVLPCVDTLYRVVDNTVIGTLDRSAIYAVQTPQGFFAHHIMSLHSRYASCGENEKTSISDDAQLVMREGGACYTVAGDERNRKITVKNDIVTMENTYFSQANNASV